jgi:uncharacterized membrane protein YkvA (DUF1232 family)
LGECPGDMDRRSTKWRRIMGNEAEKKGISVIDWILLAVSVIYAISPIDIIPDIPVVGWIDDFFFLASSGLNVIQKGIGQTNTTLSSILKLIKFITLFLGIIIVLLILLFGTVILKIIQNN